MARPAMDAQRLRGKHVAFTGRLACLTRAEAAKLVKAHGGTFVAAVNLRTSVLVVGQEGWPLQKDGRLTTKLQKAQRLQRLGYSLQILQEQEFLSQVGLDASSHEVRRLYTTSQLASLLDLTRNRLRSWINAGLIRPVETVDGLDYFDYRQVTGAKTLCELTRAGVGTEAIRRSLEQLRSWYPGVEEPLAQLAVLESNGKLLIRVDDDLVEPSGQRHFDFAEPPEQTSLKIQPAVPLAASRQCHSVDEWFDLACEHEDAGRLAEAEQAYRQALLLGGPDRDIGFNLANVLYALGHKQRAAERFYQVVELDASFAEAWNNLGVVLADLQRREEAKAAFEKALALSPHYADAHYNLADLLEESGRNVEARSHWQALVRQDPQSPWGRHAKERLSARSS